MQSFDVRDFGAVADGKTLDTAAINAAINAANQAGGGQVYLRPGRYLCGTIHMQSHVTLSLDPGTILLGTNELGHYQAVQYKGQRTAWYRGLILMENLTDARICGPGTIDGQKVFDTHGEENMRGPHTIVIANSRRIMLRDVAIVDSANYAVLIRDSHELDVHNLTATGGWDAIHIRGNENQPCRTITITGCRFFTGDDCIAGCYADDLIIHNCLLNTACNAIRWIGPARHMIVDQCLIFGPGRHPHRTSGRKTSETGITLQPGAWAPMPGEMDDVHITNITMHNVHTPVMVLALPGSTIGWVDIQRITATGISLAACSFESWGDQPIGQVTLRDCDFTFTSLALAQEPVELIKTTSNSRPLPAWALYSLRVDNLEFERIHLHAPAEDARPAVLTQGVSQLSYRDLRVPDWAADDLLVQTDHIPHAAHDRTPTSADRLPGY